METFQRWNVGGMFGVAVRCDWKLWQRRFVETMKSDNRHQTSDITHTSLLSFAEKIVSKHSTIDRTTDRTSHHPTPLCCKWRLESRPKAYESTLDLKSHLATPVVVRLTHPSSFICTIHHQYCQTKCESKWRTSA